MHSNIFIISGPSGAGEDSIIEGISKIIPLERIVTTTTRERRESDPENAYYFISKEAFEKGIENGEFAEYAKQYNGNLYGVTKAELERVSQSKKIGVWKIEYQGVMTVKKLFPEIQSILITVPSLDILEARIRRRSHVTDEYIQERMEYTKEWLKHTDIYDYTIVNEEGELAESIQQALVIIQQAKR
jgi:guanylate kinase